MIEANDAKTGRRAGGVSRRPSEGRDEIRVVPHASGRRGREAASAWSAHFCRGRHRRRSGRPVFHEMAVAFVQPHREDFVGGTRDKVEVTVVIDVDLNRGHDVCARSNGRKDLERGAVDRRELKHGELW